ncbi:MAG: hypothetical protein ACK2TV_16185, partial [Anaerolineales bacterium]
MASELADIFFLLSSPPGNWIYHLIICLAMVLTIAFAFSKLAETSKSDGKPHLLWGSLILLI